MVTYKLFSIVLYLSQETWPAAMSRFWQTGQTLNVLPYKYNPITCSVSPNELFPFRLFWYFMYAMYILDVLYLAHASRSVTIPTVSTKVLTNFYMHFLSRLIALLINSLMALNLEDLALFSNCFLKTATRYKCISKSNKTKHLHRFTSKITTFCLLQPVFVEVHYVFQRRSPKYWPSKYMGFKFYNNSFLVTCYALVEGSYAYISLFGTAFVVLPVVTYNVFAMRWVESLRLVINFYNNLL